VARAGLGPDEVEEAAEGGAGGLEVRGEGLQAAELVRQLARVQLHLPISKRGINSVWLYLPIHTMSLPAHTHNECDAQ
jgi:hypothetical protein